MTEADSWAAVEEALEARRVWLGQRIDLSSLSLPPMEQLTLPALQGWLQYFGGVLIFLQAEQGAAKARAKGLHDEFELKMARAKGKLPEDLPKSTSEATKESMVLASDDDLWSVKWRQMEADGVQLIQDGYIRAFDKAWETISRQITALTKESEMTSGRTN